MTSPKLKTPREIACEVAIEKHGDRVELRIKRDDVRWLWVNNPAQEVRKIRRAIAYAIWIDRLQRD